MRSRVDKVIERPRVRGNDRDSARRVVPVALAYRLACSLQLLARQVRGVEPRGINEDHHPGTEARIRRELFVVAPEPWQIGDTREGDGDVLCVAASYLWTFTSEWQQPGRQPPPGGTRWLSEAIANIREGLLPYLAAPRFLARAPASKRSFPTLLELEAMPHGTLE